MASSPARNLQDPVDYMSKGWFPVNGNLLRQVQSKLKSGGYDADREGLLNDLKGDFSLFGYCLKEIGMVVPKERAEENPIDIMRTTEFGELKRILDVTPDKISPHIFDPNLKAQLARVKHLVVACSTAETIAEKVSINSDIAFSAAFARQVGLMLVAYNYPRIYSQAITALKAGNEDFEKTLKRTLGFSPVQLGIKIMLGWNRNRMFRLGIGDTSVVTGEDNPLMAYTLKEEDEHGQELKQICEVSDALARLSDPEHFPATAKDWDYVNSEVESYLGPDGMKLITDRIGENQAQYLILSPELFKMEIAQDKSVKASNHQYSKKLLSENSFVKALHGNVQEEYSKVYSALTPGQVSTQGLALLVSNVMPLCGFVGGCIYLADMRSAKLVPTVKFGNSKNAVVKALSMLEAGQKLHPALDALNSMIPLRQENVLVGNEVISHVTGTFGNTEKKGVLFLQMGQELLRQDRAVSLQHFKALRQALNDCLNLKS